MSRENTNYALNQLPKQNFLLKKGKYWNLIEIEKFEVVASSAVLYNILSNARIH